MSRFNLSRIGALFIIFALVLAACQPAATPTPTPRPSPTATEVVAEATEAAVEATEAATEEAVEVTEEAVEVTEEASEATEEAATEEATEEAVGSTEATEEAVMEATEEVAMEMTEEAAEATQTAQDTTPMPTIADLATGTEDLSTLLAAVQAAGLTETLAQDGPFTVFAPTNEAFETALAALGLTAEELLANTELLTDVLTYHVVAGTVNAADITDGMTATALNGDELTFTVSDGMVMVNEATVTTADLGASNGVVHIIDAVLLPPADAMEATEEAAMEMTEEAAEATEVAMAPTMAPEATEMAMEATDESMGMATDMANAVMISPDDEVVVGFSAALTGSVAVHGINIQRGAELALADRPTVTVGDVTFNVRLDAQDDLCSAEGGQAVANRFISDPQIVGVVGPMCSSGCRAAAPVYDSVGLPHISPSCTAADLTTSGYTTFSRTIVSDAFQGVVMADYIFNELGITRIATIHDGSPYGEGLVSVLTERFLSLGGEVVASDAISTDDTDFRGLLEDIAQEDPDLIYFGGFNEEGALLAQQRGDAGLEDVIFMGADGIRSTEFVELSGDAAEGSYASNSVPAASEALDAFLALYVETYGEEPPSSFHTNAFDATNLLLDAIEAVGIIDDRGDLVIDRAALNDYIHSVQNFEGLTGTLNADGMGEMAVSDIGIFQVIDGEFVQISTGSLDAEGNASFAAVEMETPAAEATEEAAAEATEEAAAEATAEATTSP